jgi:hypothetical protein
VNDSARPGFKPWPPGGRPGNDDDEDEASRAFLQEHDLGNSATEIPPRRLLLGTTFCRGVVSGMIGAGDLGKTAVRIAQGLSVAMGKRLSGEHVFQQVPVLYVTLEDDAIELRRRVWAAILHHELDPAEVKRWFHLFTPSHPSLRLGSLNTYRQFKRGFLRGQLEQQIEYYSAGLVIIDPLIKAHQVPENSNEFMDLIVGQLAELAQKYDCDMDFCHHVAKGSEAGNAEASRGATAITNAARLVQTLTRMSDGEAKDWSIAPEDRRYYVRIDSAKANIARPAEKALWFHLKSIALGNTFDPVYPHGDHVQAAEAWPPPAAEARINSTAANAILDAIDAGLDDGRRYTRSRNAAPETEAWRIVQQHTTGYSKKQAQDLIDTWVVNGVLIEVTYTHPRYRNAKIGLKRNPVNRPGMVFS